MKFFLLSTLVHYAIGQDLNSNYFTQIFSQTIGALRGAVNRPDVFSQFTTLLRGQQPELDDGLAAEGDFGFLEVTTESPPFVPSTAAPTGPPQFTDLASLAAYLNSLGVPPRIDDFLASLLLALTANELEGLENLKNILQGLSTVLIPDLEGILGPIINVTTVQLEQLPVPIVPIVTNIVSSLLTALVQVLTGLLESLRAILFDVPTVVLDELEQLIANLSLIAVPIGGSTTTTVLPTTTT